MPPILVFQWSDHKHLGHDSLITSLFRARKATNYRLIPQLIFKTFRPLFLFHGTPWDYKKVIYKSHLFAFKRWEHISKVYETDMSPIFILSHQSIEFLVFVKTLIPESVKNFCIHVNLIKLENLGNKLLHYSRSIWIQCSDRYFHKSGFI